MRTLKQGSKGADVVVLQKYLKLSEIDGIFGKNTTAALKTWQMTNGLNPDGVCGPNTWAKLKEVYPPDVASTGADRVVRARSAIGSARYSLGCGGNDPDAPTPAQRTTRKGKLDDYCDCSGFQAWVHRRSRKPSVEWEWWFSTDSVWTDITGEQQLFERVEPGQEQPGDVIVYPDKYRNGKKVSEGHIALVVDPAQYVVVECGIRSSERKKHPDAPAIGERERKDMWYNKRREFGRYKAM